MKTEYAFSKAKQGAIIHHKGKSRITIYIDTDILDEFRKRADNAGYGYQTMINEVLRQYIGKTSKPIDEETLRKILREELAKVD